MNQVVILDQPNQKIIKRPTAITIICILGFTGAVVSIPMLFSEIALQLGAWFRPYAGFSALVSLISMVALWRTKRWGLYTYATFALVNQVVLLFQGEWNIVVLLAQTLIVLVASFHLLPGAKPVFYQLTLYIKRKVWTIIVAYMVGVHNFYKEEQKDPEEIVYTIDDTEEQEDGEPV